MYTEDDKKIKVKKDNSNTKDSDFYTAFNGDDKDDKKSKKGKKKSSSKAREVELKEEEDFEDFYSVSSSETDAIEENNGKKNIIKLIIAGVLLVVLIALIIIIFVVKNKDNGDIELAKSNISLDVGQKEYISYKVINTNSTIKPSFTSSDENVAIVSENGEVTAIAAGEAIITVHYAINNENKEKTITIKVNGESSVDRKISLTLKLENGKNNTWTSKDVTINPEASSIYGISSIKYAVNCDNNCEYKDITNNKITITSSGITKVKIVATDKNNQQTTEEVTIKIDKNAPSVKLNTNNTSIVSTSDVEVCALCTDSLSGCKQSKVCKKYSSSKSNQTITVEDAAGNKTTSPSFSVTINKVVAPCILSVSSDGTVTATLREEATYYGFNSNYTGDNKKSEKIDFGSNTAGGLYSKAVYYYVQNQNGSKGRCFITVIKKCTTDGCTFSQQ